MLFFLRGHTRMSTILFFTSDRLAFANLSPTATTEKIILTPDPVDGNRLFIGNSTMIGYDGRCNISTFDGSQATLIIDTMNKRVGIGISSPTAALDVVDATGVRIIGPTNITGDTNITGATVFTGNSRVTGTATAGAFYGSAMGLTSIPAARIVGSLAAGVYATGTIPTSALSGYNNGNIVFSGVFATDTITVSSITSTEGIFSSISTGNAGIGSLTTSYTYTSTLNVGSLFAGSISSGSIGSLAIANGDFSSINTNIITGTALNTRTISTGFGSASSFTVGTLFAGSISSGTITSLSSAIVGIFNTLDNVSTSVSTLSNYLTSVSNAGVTTSNNLTGVSNSVITTSNNVISVSNAGVTTSTNVSTLSNYFSTVSNSFKLVSSATATNILNIISVSNTANFLLTVSNLSAITLSTSYGFFSTLSAGIIYGRFVGDGSGLTGIAGGVSVLPPVLSTTLLSTGILTASNISTIAISTNTGYASSFTAGALFVTTTNVQNGLFSSISSGQGYISSLRVDSLQIGLSTGYINMGDLITTTLSSGSVRTVNISAGSANFSTLSTGIAFIDITNTRSLSSATGTLSSLTVGMLYAGTISSGSIGNVLTAAGAFSSISAGTAAISLLNINTGTASSFTIGTLFAGAISSGSLVALSSAINSVSNTVNYLLTVSNISAATISTSYGFFSTISAGSIFGKFVGDGSGLTGIPTAAGLLTVSNLLNAVSTNVTTVSTNLNTVSNLVNAVSTNVTTVSTNLNTVSNTVNFLLSVSNISATTISTSYGFFSTLSVGTFYGKHVGDGSGLTGIPTAAGLLTVSNLVNEVSTNVTTVSTNLNTVSNTVNFLLTVNNLSDLTISTSYGFFSTISAGTVFGKFVGDGSALTGIPTAAGLLTVSNLLNAVSTNVTTVSTNLNTVSNLVNSVSTNVTTVSTNLNIVSNTVNFLLTVSNISAATTSTSYGFFSTISAGTVFGKFVGDGSALTGIPTAAGLLTVSNLLNAVSTNVTTVSTNLNTVSNLLNAVSTNVTTVSTNLNTVSNTVNFLLTVSNVSAATLSTSYGFFSTISAGTIYARFVGDGTSLTGIPTTAGLLAVSNLVNAVSTNVTTVSTNLNTISNLLNAVSTNVTTVSTNLNIVCNSVNFLLSVSNISAATTSTSYGFFSTISAGTVFGKFVGDGIGLTGIPTTAGLLAVSNLVNAVSTNVTTVSTNLNTVSNTINFLLSVSNISSVTISTSYGFFSTVSAGKFYGKFIGDGSLITNLPVTGITNVLSTQVFYTSTISTANITSLQGYISSLTVDSLSFGFSNSYMSMGDIITTSISTIQTFTSSLVTNNLQVGTVSSLSYIAFPGLQQGYNQSVVAEQSTGTGTQELLLFRGSTNTDRIRMQTTGSIVFETGVGARVFPAVESNVTPAMIINTSSNVGIGIAAPTTTLDVGGTGRFQILSSQQLFVSTISSGTVYGKFVGDGSGLTGVSGTGGISILPPILSTTLLSTGNLTATNISAATISTSYGFFSTISAGTIFARFVGDGTGLTGIPTTAGLLAVSNLVNAVSTNVTTVSTNLNTVSNLVNAVSTNVTTVSTNLNTVSNNLNILLTVSNISAATISTSYGFFSTISAGTVFGKFVGDGTGLTGIPTTAGLLAVSNLVNAVSTNVTTVSTNLNTVSNLVNAVSTNVTTISTNLNTVSNTVNFLLSVSNISAATISTSYGFFSTISAGTVFGKFVGDGTGLTGIPTTAGLLAVSNLVNAVSTNTTTVSTNLNTVSNTVNFLLTVSNISAATTSTSYGFFSTLSSGTIYAKFVGDGSGLTGIASGMSALPPILSTTLLSTGLLTASNISVATISTNYGFFSTLSAGTIYARFVGDGSGLTGIASGSGGISALPPILSTTLLSTGLLTANNISVATLSTNYGFFSTLSAGTIYARFVGDGSGLLGITATIPQNITVNSISTTIISAATGFTSSFTIGMFTATTATVQNGLFSSISTGQGYISSLRVDSLQIGLSTGYINMGDLITTTLSSGSVRTGNISSGSATITSLSAGTAYIGNLSVSQAYFSSISTTLAWIGQATISSISVNTINSGTAFISSLRTSESRVSTVTANVLSSYIVYASSVNTPNIYVTNIYANDGGIANVVASSLNASRAVFVQVIASSFQGALVGTNLMTVQTL